MSEQTWHEARLIPTSGISGADEQERRATSALLAVMSVGQGVQQGTARPLRRASREPSRPSSRSRSLQAARRSIPDGLIRVTRGTAIVDRSRRGQDRQERARGHAARELPRRGARAGLRRADHHQQRDPRHRRPAPHQAWTSASCKKVAIHHWSWTYLLSDRGHAEGAPRRHRPRAGLDPRRAHPLPRAPPLRRPGARGHGRRLGAGPRGVTAGTLRANDKQLPRSSARFDALLRYAALRLGRQLGTDVVHVLSRKEQADPALRAQALTTSIVDSRAR